jgi:hypothetical protein
MGKFIDLTGRKFCDVTVLEFHSKNKHGGLLWVCLCDCGNKAVISGDCLKAGSTKSCGCRKYSRNGDTKSKNSLYQTWRAMMRRCYEENHHAYNRYGGRGIFVCDRWHDYNNFVKDLVEKPENLTLDRINNDGPYSKENCKWSNKTEQARNRKNPWITRRENLNKEKNNAEE